MAKVVDSITVEVKPRLTVDLETAQVCAKLVNLFLEANDGYRAVLTNRTLSIERRWAHLGHGVYCSAEAKKSED